MHDAIINQHNCGLFYNDTNRRTNYFRKSIAANDISLKIPFSVLPFSTNILCFYARLFGAVAFLSDENDFPVCVYEEKELQLQLPWKYLLNVKQKKKYIL